MIARLFILLTLLPALELYLLIKIGKVIGGFETILLVVGMGILGAFLAKREGLRVIRAWQAAMTRGQLPEEGVLSGLLVLVGAVLLITPGVITDFMGLALLFGPTRRQIGKVVKRWTERHLQVRTATHFRGPFPGNAHAGRDVIDVEGEASPEHRLK